MVGQRLKAEDVSCTRLVTMRGAPVRIFVDNGSEFSGRIFDLWAHHQKVAIDFTRPGKPTENSIVESFNGSFRDECLNVHSFETMAQAKVMIEVWRVEYNESRPHEALKDMTPSGFAAEYSSIDATGMTPQAEKSNAEFGPIYPSGSGESTCRHSDGQENI